MPPARAAAGVVDKLSHVLRLLCSSRVCVRVGHCVGPLSGLLACPRCCGSGAACSWGVLRVAGVLART